MEIGHWPMIRTASLSMHVPSSHWNRTRISRYAPTSMLSQRDIGGTGRALSNCVFLRRLRVRRKNTAEPARKIRRRRPDIIRTIRLGYSNSRLEASDNRIKVTIRMAYGFHHANNPIALVMLRRGGLDIRPPQPRTQPTKTAEASFLCYPVKLRDGSSFSPFEPCRPTSPFADRDTITPRMAEFQRFRNSYCGTPR